MSALTYRQLRDLLASALEEQLDQTVTVAVDGEFYPVKHVGVSDNSNDILDPGHVILDIND